MTRRQLFSAIIAAICSPFVVRKVSLADVAVRPGTGIFDWYDGPEYIGDGKWLPLYANRDGKGWRLIGVHRFHQRVIFGPLTTPNPWVRNS